ncbi:hypothetical protein [Tsukamurella hominis]|uniref:hypothetical protein n=1 Tax=Tsukamurella hominis TaxID=1970232 RepID=UPI0039ED852A
MSTLNVLDADGRTVDSVAELLKHVEVEAGVLQVTTTRHDRYLVRVPDGGRYEVAPAAQDATRVLNSDEPH